MTTELTRLAETSGRFVLGGLVVVVNTGDYAGGLTFLGAMASLPPPVAALVADGFDAWRHAGPLDVTLRPGVTVRVVPVELRWERDGTVAITFIEAAHLLDSKGSAAEWLAAHPPVEVLLEVYR